MKKDNLKNLSNQLLLNKFQEMFNQEVVLDGCDNGMGGVLVREEILSRMPQNFGAEFSEARVFDINSDQLIMLGNKDLLNKFYDACILLHGKHKILKDIEENNVAWYKVREEVLSRMEKV